MLDSIFPLWSISKVITATAIMVLVEDGRLGLNRPVAEYIPEFVGEGKSAEQHAGLGDVREVVDGTQDGTRALEVARRKRGIGPRQELRVFFCHCAA